MSWIKKYAHALLDAHRLTLTNQGKSSKKHALEVGMTVVFLVCLMLLATLFTPYNAKLDTPNAFSGNESSQPKYYRAHIDAVHESTLDITMLDGPRKGQQKTIDKAATLFDSSENRNAPEYKAGQTVVVGDTTQDSTLYLVDHYRIPLLFAIALIFISLVLLIGGRQGFGSLIGLGVTMIVIVWFILPFIINGYSPLLVCIIGAYIIALASITIAHGFKRRTFLSVACVVVVLALIAAMAYIAVTLMNFIGLSDESAYFFANQRPEIDMRGILTGGIIIASLGVLDDVVTAQVATVDELQKANPKLSVYELFMRATSVGKEHISALVNTLVLVYVGAALPMIVATSTYVNSIVFVNGEYVATEITRTLIASIGLIVAVPISTLIAAFYLHKHALDKSIRTTH